MTDLLTQTIHGLTFGTLIGLVAIGYTMVFGIIKLINFAHGEFYMVGGFSGLLALTVFCGEGRLLHTWSPEGKLLLALLCSACFVGVLAVVTERLAYRPIRSAGKIAALLTAVGVSLLLQNLGIAVFGAKQVAFPETIQNEHFPRLKVRLEDLRAGQNAGQTIVYQAPIRDLDGNVITGANGKPLGLMTETLVDAGQKIDQDELVKAIAASPLSVYAYPTVTVSKKQLVVFFALIVSAAALYVLVQKTRMGRAMRAVSHDMQAASLMGIDCSKIVTITFAIGGALAGMGGVLAGGMFISTADPMMGFMFGLKAFIAAVLGGIGNIPGALLGGLVLGLVEQFTQHYADGLLFKGASAYRDAIAFLILIIVLLVRPRGFFGRMGGEKV